ncbi:Rieske (2Fe-2S) protein [Streptomyces pactum]|uniref:Cytochrome bc1 complex Rieske iron-sulfur subunit n=1 Tax=Streptomyces pactum TaxID=68249 RepID=A0ABS0NGM4_9ACTN|nr:Rieske (2Fe-2S) protein [Streptomyces pactum]MBH5334292.1 Rieske (2Fe-2S) protein [Streptomyces pactum]
MSSQPPARRTVLRGAALAGAAGMGVAATACGGEVGAKASATPTAPVDLGSPDEVPAGGTKIFREDRVLVTQVAEGEYKAFSAVCTHRNCVLNGLREDRATCSCHGSEFDTRTGKVVTGPAVAPLPPVPVRTEGGRLIIGPES